MFMQYSNEAVVFSLLQNINEDKRFICKDVLYRFYMMEHALYIDIINNRTHEKQKSLEVAKNVKTDYGVYVEDRKHVHMVVATKKYDLVYICFDGNAFKEKTICRYSNDDGIPSNPVVIAHDGFVHLAVSFIRMSNMKSWTLKSYTKQLSGWFRNTIDKGTGLTYTQHDLCYVENRIYVVYKYFNESVRSLKYSIFDIYKKQWCKPRTIYDNGVDKYIPKVFINNQNQLYFLWLEIDNEVFLCIGSRLYDINYLRLCITDFVDNVVICSDQNHIYAVSSDDKRFFYDLCCKKEISADHTGTSKKGSEPDLDNKVKLLVEIKKQYDDCIKVMKNNLDKVILHYTKDIESMKNQNLSLKEELEKKDSRIKEIEDMVAAMMDKKGQKQQSVDVMEKKPVSGILKTAALKLAERKHKTSAKLAKKTDIE